MTNICIICICCTSLEETLKNYDNIVCEQNGAVTGESNGVSIKHFYIPSKTKQKKSLSCMSAKVVTTGACVD